MKLTDDLRAIIHAQLVARPVARPRSKRRVGTGLWHQAFASDALGVGVKQIPAAREHLRRHGVTAEFDSTGRCIITSDKQYRDVARASGLYDGRHGWDVKNHDGLTIETGRTPVIEREKFAKQLSLEI